MTGVARRHQPGAGRGRTEADRHDLAATCHGGGRTGALVRFRARPLAPDPSAWTYTPPVTFDQPGHRPVGDTVVLWIAPQPPAALPTVAETDDAGDNPLHPLALLRVNEMTDTASLLIIAAGRRELPVFATVHAGRIMLACTTGTRAVTGARGWTGVRR